MKNIFILIIVAITLFSLADMANAATFCVDTAQELQDALTTAQSNSQNNTIRIVQGTHIGNFVYESTQSHSLTIEGGYTAGCVSRVVNASNTVLGGVFSSGKDVLKLNSTSAAVTYTVDGLRISGTDPSSELANALYINTQSGTVILKNAIIGATEGCGGVYITNANEVEVSNSVFSDNLSWYADGAGLSLNNVHDVINLTNNSFIDNTAWGGASGGGISIKASAGVTNITDNKFTGNISDDGLGGAVYVEATGNITLTNNIVGGNGTNSVSGGLYLSTSGSLIFANNTIVNNRADFHGGGVYLGINAPSVVYIFNNIVWSNISDSIYDIEMDYDPSGDTVIYLFNNNFDQSPAGTNIPFPIDSSNLDNVDPLFVNAAAGNHHLKSNSPLINMGSNAASGLPDYDFDGLPRILYGTVDMGAYEYSSGNCTLTVTKAGTGSGSITGEGLSCGASTCTGTYTCGESVTISTSASAGSTFTSWTGCDLTDGNTCTVMMNGNESVTATFTLSQRTLSVGRSGTGSGKVTGTGINCGSDCGESYGYNTVVTLTATPDAGSTFSGWTGCTSTDENTCSVTMTANKSVTAAFALDEHILTATKTGTGSGTLTASGLSCDGNTCTGTYGYNTSVTITAAAASGSMLSDWIGCDAEDGNTCTVTMTSDKTVVATFTLIPPDTHVLTIEKTGSGTVIGTGIDCGTDCAQAYDDGTKVTLTASPAPGYVFSSWSGGGCSGTDTCEVTMNSDVTVGATFTPTDGKQYKLKVKKARKNKGNGTITSNDGNITCGDTCMYAYPTGTTVTLSAVANEGSTFIGWKPATLNCSGTDPCTVTVDKAKSVQAIFVGDYALKVVNKSKKGGTGTVTSTPIGINCTTGSTTDCESLYGYGEHVTLSALADTGSVFTGWYPTKLCPGIDVCVVPMDKKRTIKAVFSGP